MCALNIHIAYLGYNNVKNLNPYFYFKIFIIKTDNFFTKNAINP